MAEREWLVAENGSGLFAVPRHSVSGMVSDAELIELPFTSESVSRIFLHGGRAVPVFKDDDAGFLLAEGDLVVLDLEGELLALPVLKIAGFCVSDLVETAPGPSSGLFRGRVRFNGAIVAALETEDLYKVAGFI